MLNEIKQIIYILYIVFKSDLLKHFEIAGLWLKCTEELA